MNEKTYMKMIADNYGGLKKDELLIKLEKLVVLAKGEFKSVTKQSNINKFSTSIKLENDEDIKDLLYTVRYISYKGITFEEKVEEVKNSRLQAYDQVMEILRLSNLYGAWYNAEIFDTASLYHYFMVEVDKLGSGIELKDNKFRIV